MNSTARPFLAAAFVAAMAVSASPARADDARHDAWHENHFAVFGGITHAEDENLFTLGADFEYRISDYVGAGAFFDAAVQDPKHQILAAALFVHPYKGAKLILGAGAERADGIDGRSHNEFLFRAGAGYDIHIDDRFTATPTIALDVVDGHKSGVFGVALGVGF